MTPSGEKLKGSVAVVTGGEGGIGSAIVGLFADSGATVVSVDALSEPRADSPVRRHAGAHYENVDITHEAAVARLFQQVRSAHGPVDILVNCAGIVGPAKQAHELDEAEFDLLFQVNVKGTWLVTKHALPQMMALGRGSIVNFSSIAGVVGGTSAQALYHASKGAIRAMSKADAVAYAPHGIRVNAVFPGSIDTPMSRETAAKFPGGAEAHSAAIIGKHPLGRRGTPAEIAAGVLYLASSDASFVTGAELAIDGGYTAQ
ncbi:SDR family NAD(P)-dependent oxidoreductase [Ruicaihuangia caeni]|uniref:SDR family NAD(P)-dependent oxidoreductase n=1 Tax=Ruicaihuangia caeni TaxID=3042517 RepID=A0AAW6T8S2_9MICO|nr:SDR family NAD(P)-dependent oxidoreductase [Klugiella sp. YN-L-19]MDI2099624.1 SDR family NAD(P)-dependent oxidoreductase [Klugiella sp. YN-L-19]